MDDQIHHATITLFRKVIVFYRRGYVVHEEWTALKAVLSAVFVIWLVGSLAGCDNLFGNEETEDRSDDTVSGTGELIYNSETVELTQLWFNDFGERRTGVYSIDVWIGTDGLDFDPRRGTGKAVYLELLFSTPNVSAGTYSFFVCTYSPSNLTAGKFCDDSAIGTLGGGAETYDSFTNGTVTIEINGDEYTFTGEATTENGHSTEFSYVGLLSGDL